jgi:hypothetical protein
MWNQVLQTSLQVPFKDFTTDYSFNSPFLIISAFATFDYSDNYRIGRVRPIYAVTGGLAAKAPSRTIRLQEQFIQFFQIPYPYKLEFTWYVWLPQLTLTFYEPSVGDIPNFADIRSQLVESRANVALLQQQLDRIENKINSPTI